MLETNWNFPGVDLSEIERRKFSAVTPVERKIQPSSLQFTGMPIALFPEKYRYLSDSSEPDF